MNINEALFKLIKMKKMLFVFVISEKTNTKLIEN